MAWHPVLSATGRGYLLVLDPTYSSVVHGAGFGLCGWCEASGSPSAPHLQGQMLPEGGQAEAMATIFVWLRYSSSRQLTWQRNYNTQPRILGEAQSRLTHAIAEVSITVSSAAPLSILANKCQMCMILM